MPTARSWTDSLADLRHLLRFRAQTVRRPRAAAVAALVLLACTLAAMVVPALVDGAGTGARAEQLRSYLPSMLSGMLVLSIVSAVSSGGGRELIPRDQAAIHPITTTTEHLGALALSPLNLAFLVQTWLLLGATAYIGGSDGWVVSQLVVLVWIAFTTALAQACGWTFEIVRRSEHGVAVIRTLGVVGALAGVGLQLSGRFVPLLDGGPTRRLASLIHGTEQQAWLAVPALLVLTVLAVAVGAVPARAALRRSPRDELKVESGAHPARQLPAGDAAMLVRIDRASVWRSVPMRRGLILLAVGPGLVALAGAMSWTSVMVLPGLVISGVALLFGVNVWCLDSRGVLWRESLPVPPRAVFLARARVLTEWLLGAAALTVLLGSVRAGMPSAAEAVTILTLLVVVTLQVVAVAMSWSGRRPFSVNLRSARATPAPPMVMVGYSSRLALSTTFTALIFSAASTGSWWISPVLAVPFLAWSLLRLRRAGRRWVAPAPRARVVMTVAG
ncbi:MAG: hypothetical protein AVDCRST_MAG60-224 [uncultured Nocardioides sp.]|uniref:ABC-2 type transport system permease protein n=1 Tax=uncultured Nocardioides sp. TaxID=198441 RepID=A0A6J4N0J8_9ACTN|nr:MAG: hypothetical protein AVDCRST_MAG60-224 [uncultured Nocardioides sp.]